MDQKQFEERLDGLADKVSKSVSEGVKKMEDAFDRGRENIAADRTEGGFRKKAGSPRAGLVIFALGLAWLLNNLGFFNQLIFPILLMVVGVYLIIRNRENRDDENHPGV